MSDTTLHSLYNKVNSKPRYAVQDVVREVSGVNQSLAEKHVIQEPNSSRENITKTVFEKMTTIEKIQAASAEYNYLGNILVQKNIELETLKQTLKM